MKKLIVVTGMIIGIAFLSAPVSAQTDQSPGKTTKTQNSQSSQNPAGKFVDKDKDGVCDNFQNRGKQGNCAKFVDENGDGVCDNCKGNRNCGQRNCCGKGMQKSNCPGMNPGNCCGKGTGHKHRHGFRNCQQTAHPQPEKK